MKKFSCLFLLLVIANCVHAQGVNKYGQITTDATTYVNKNGGIGGDVGNNKNGQQVTKPLAIGDAYQGGIVAYILVSGDPGYSASVQKGLIAAASDQSAGAAWGCYGTYIIGADGTALGRGNQNTIDIMYGCATAGIAARLCGDLILNGYSDWYLPSRDELNKLYINRVAVGGFSSLNYWSSSMVSANFARFQDFSNGVQNNGGGKDYPGRVRAVRSF